jgi:predicted nuclease with TOPRIM domain
VRIHERHAVVSEAVYKLQKRFLEVEEELELTAAEYLDVASKAFAGAVEAYASHLVREERYGPDEPEPTPIQEP